MGRELTARLIVTGTLMAKTPVHVGGLGDSADTDLPLAQNGRGEYYIPGTSLCGAFRGWCAAAFGETPVNALFGFQSTERDADKSEKQHEHASFVIVDDVKLDAAVRSEIRDGVGIDRKYGTAARRAKFDRAILPRGTELSVRMIWELAENADRSKAMLGHLLEALAHGKIRVGAAQTRGLGHITGTLTVKEQSLNSRAGIIQALTGGGGDPGIDVLKSADPSLADPADERAVITIGWQARGPVMVKAGYDGMGVDSLPLTSGYEPGKVSLVLPGSSIKGALRSQAERIVRTVRPDLVPTGADFHEQIQLPVVNELFGSKKAKKGGSGLRGALSIDDCYSDRPLDASLWRKVEQATDNERNFDKAVAPAGNDKDKQRAPEVSYYKRELWKYLREIDEGQEDITEKKDLLFNPADYKHDTRRFRIEHHVAIDRWTGGASDGALFSVLAPRETKWEGMRLTLDLGRLKVRNDGGEAEETNVEDKPDPFRLRKRAVMLLLLVLRDLVENRIPLGFGVNRGLGEVAIDTIEGLDKLPDLIGVRGKPFRHTIEKGKLTFEDGEIMQAVEGAWNGEW